MNLLAKFLQRNPEPKHHYILRYHVLSREADWRQSCLLPEHTWEKILSKKIGRLGFQFVTCWSCKEKLSEYSKQV